MIRNFATTTAIPKKGYKVVVIGGGSAGVSVAAQLGQSPLFANKKDILIVEPKSEHFYQPFWTLVGGGLKPFEASVRPMQSVIPPSADWLKNKVHKVVPENNLVLTDDGGEISYEYLVVAPGISINYDKVEGLAEALGKDGVTTNYSADVVEKTAEFMKAFKGGNAIFTQPKTPIKCAGAPQKIMYLFEEHVRKSQGLREKTGVALYSGIGKIFGVDKYANALAEICQKRDIGVNLLHDLVAIDAKKKEAIFENLSPESNGTKVAVKYDFLHVTPPMGPLPFIKDSGLGNSDGWVDVDKHTTQHVTFKNVFSLGDASSLPTSKTAAAVASESGVTSRNLLDVIDGKEPTAKYSGYTSCPLVTGNGKLILAEFNGYDLSPYETFPFNQGVERSSMYFLKSNVMNKVYWDLMLKGNWTGPSPYRPFLNPLNSN